jgi:pheromone shutdown protein TraB
MDAITAIASAISAGLEMLNKHIDDPKRRLKARLEFKEKMRLKMMEIINEKDTQKVDQKLLDFLDLLRAM